MEVNLYAVKCSAHELHICPTLLNQPTNNQNIELQSQDIEIEMLNSQ